MLVFPSQTGICQPQNPVTISSNFKNYVASATYFSVPAVSGFDAVINKSTSLTKTGTVTDFVATSAGLGIKGNGTTGVYSRSVNIPAQAMWIACSMVCNTASTATKTLYAIGSNAASLGAFIGISSGDGTNNTFIFQYRGVDSVGTLIAKSGLTPSVGNVYNLVFVCPNNTIASAYAYVNGIKVTTSIPGQTNTTFTTALVNESWAALKRGTTGNYSNDTILMTARGYQIPEYLARQISINPWQIFQSDNLSTYYDLRDYEVKKIRNLQKQTRISQPQSAEINWSNSLTQGLMVAFNSAYPLTNPVNRSPATGQTGTGITTAYSKDLALKSFSGSGTGKYQYATNVETDKVTFIWSGYVNLTQPVIGRIISAYNGAGLGRFDLYIGTASSEGVYFQALRSTNGNWQAPTAFKAVNGVFAVTYDGSNTSNIPEFYINGSLFTGTLTTVSSPSGALVTAGSNYSVGGRLDVTTRQMAGNLSFAAAWNRNLTASEIFSLSKNPWQIFQPDTRSVYYPEVTQLSAYQSKIYRSGVWASVPVKRYDGVQWVNIAARPSV